MFSVVFIDFFYIYIYYRKFNAEFNKLIKHTFANNFDFIWIFSYSHLSSH